MNMTTDTKTTVPAGDVTGTPVLRVRNLSVTFDTYKGPVHVLHDVSFDIFPGEILGVVGESGAGKSMTGSAVTGLIEAPGRISGGTVELQGLRIDNLQGEDLRRIRGKRIGTIFQDPLTSLNPVYTVGDHLVETIRTHLPVSEKEAEARALALLEEVEIPHAKERMAQYPHQFSGGMRQRVAIALALCAEPELIIADEPTTALDVSVQAQIIALLRRVCKERGAAAMLITHDMGVIAETADRVMVMYHGRVLETGPVRQVLDAPRDPYTQVLMAAIPSVHQRVERLPVPEVGGGPVAKAVPWTPKDVAAAADAASAKPLLEVKDLCKDYDLSAGWLARLLAREEKKILKAVDHVSFHIRKGMVAGLTPPTSGQILFDGVDKWSPAANTVAMRRRFQMIFQDPYASLNPRWTVEQLIAEPLVVLGLTSGPAETAERVQEALRRVRMKPDDAKKYPHQFSGGQRQRIAVARALASKPEFIICDEPTSALDVSVQAQVLNLMRDLQDEFGLTYLLISHNLAVIRHMCDDIGVMQRGKLVEVGNAQVVLDDPQHAYTKDLMAAIPDIAHVH
jgi:ABC-type glutathione transport system ATPase component